MKKLLIGLALALAAAAQTVDEIKPGQSLAVKGWKKVSADTFARGGTSVQIRQGKVISVWGEHLVGADGQKLDRGDDDQILSARLGKAERTLYGCGQQNQTVRFFDRLHLEVTSINGKVSQIRAY